MLIFYNTVLNFLIIQFYDMQLHNMNDISSWSVTWWLLHLPFQHPKSWTHTK